MKTKRRSITEKDKDIIEGWHKELDKINLKTLPKFLKSLTENYEHDYGTICHAVAVAAVAAAKAVNRSPQGGITGFQAGAVFWEFYRRWLHEEGPARLVKYEQMLYPQNASQFAKVIDKGTWKWMQEQAKKRDADNAQAHPKVRAHWKSIAAGKVPFGYSVSKED